MEKDNFGAVGNNVLGRRWAREAHVPIGEGRRGRGRSEGANRAPTRLGACGPRVRYGAWLGGGGGWDARLYVGVVAQECSCVCSI